MDELLLSLRITLVKPPPDVWFALQRGQADLFMPTLSKGADISFSFEVRVKRDSNVGPPRFLGEFTQGSPALRFVYINSGKRAGDAASVWDRRAKIPLTVIDSKLVERAQSHPESVLEVKIAGSGRDGGPVCAGIKLSGDAWKLVPR